MWSLASVLVGRQRHYLTCNCFQYPQEIFNSEKLFQVLDGKKEGGKGKSNEGREGRKEE